MKVTQDAHIHTNWSLDAERSATVPMYVESAKKFGLTKLGFTDHFWDNTYPPANGFYGLQNYEQIAGIKPELERYRCDGITFYFGCEVEYDPARRDIALSPEVAESFDYLIVPNSHTHLIMPQELCYPYQKHVDFMIQAYEDILNSPLSSRILAMAHPFEAVCCPYDNMLLVDMISDDTFKRLFTKTAEKGIAVEINGSDIKKLSKEEIERLATVRMLRLAKECGCKFVFGSDAHYEQKPVVYESMAFVGELIGLKECDIADITVKK